MDGLFLNQKTNKNIRISYSQKYKHSIKNILYEKIKESGIPELKNRFKKPSYRLWRHKTELSQIVTSELIFRNSETLEWKNENKKAELCYSEILLNI